MKVVDGEGLRDDNKIHSLNVGDIGTSYALFSKYYESSYIVLCKHQSPIEYLDVLTVKDFSIDKVIATGLNVVLVHLE